MLSINNEALPIPGSLRFEAIAPLAGAALSLLRITAQWPALTEAETLAIASKAQGSFTLALKDPRQGQWRGFEAQVSAMDLALLWAPEGGEALWQMMMRFDESAT